MFGTGSPTGWRGAGTLRRRLACANNQLVTSVGRLQMCARSNEGRGCKSVGTRPCANQRLCAVGRRQDRPIGARYEEVVKSSPPPPTTLGPVQQPSLASESIGRRPGLAEFEWQWKSLCFNPPLLFRLSPRYLSARSPGTPQLNCCPGAANTNNSEQ